MAAVAFAHGGSVPSWRSGRSPSVAGGGPRLDAARPPAPAAAGGRRGAGAGALLPAGAVASAAALSGLSRRRGGGRPLGGLRPRRPTAGRPSASATSAAVFGLGARGEASASRAAKALRETAGSPSAVVELPALTAQDLDALRRGDPVARQERSGREGSGFVVVDVNAPPLLVMQCLSAYEEYGEMIPVVRKAEVLARGQDGGGRPTAYADYRISKFWLPVSAVHQVDWPSPEADGVVRFGLAPGQGRGAGIVLKEASGYWVVQPGANGGSRVWFSVSLRAAALLPEFLVDYAAGRALRRATSWLRPHVEDLWARRALRHARAICEEAVDPYNNNHPLVATC